MVSATDALKERYATKLTFCFYAGAIFNIGQAKRETAAWCNRLDQLISDFGGAGIELANSFEKVGCYNYIKFYLFH